MTLNDLLNDFNSRPNLNLSKRVVSNYCTWVRKVDQLLSQQQKTDMVSILQYCVKNCKNSMDAMNYIAKTVRNILSTLNDPKNASNYCCAIKKFSQVTLSRYYADLSLTIAAKDVELCKFVAATTIFASKDVVDDVRQGKLGSKDNIVHGGNQYASWHHMKYARNTSKKKGDCCSYNGMSYLADDTHMLIMRLSMLSLILMVA